MGNKMKTHKGTKKRFKKTGRGKYKHKQPNKNHLQTKKDSQRKQQLRKDKNVKKADEEKLDESLPYE